MFSHKTSSSEFFAYFSYLIFSLSPFPYVSSAIKVKDIPRIETIPKLIYGDISFYFITFKTAGAITEPRFPIIVTSPRPIPLKTLGKISDL